VRQEPALGLDVGVADLVADHRPFAGQIATKRHRTILANTGGRANRAQPAAMSRSRTYREAGAQRQACAAADFRGFSGPNGPSPGPRGRQWALRRRTHIRPNPDPLMDLTVALLARQSAALDNGKGLRRAIRAPGRSGRVCGRCGEPFGALCWPAAAWR